MLSRVNVLVYVDGPSVAFYIDCMTAATLTDNEAKYIAAARLCSAANGGCFCPVDLCIFGYEVQGKALQGTTGSLVAKQVITEPEDGIIYGVAAGLGFSATENLIYEVAAMLEQTEGYVFLATALLRSITSTFLHATASGILGYGMGKRYLERGMFLEVLPYYALAVLLQEEGDRVMLEFSDRIFALCREAGARQDGDRRLGAHRETRASHTPAAPFARGRRRPLEPELERGAD